MAVEALIIPVFIAGVITFFAPCTFPLVPAFLGFLAGARHDSGTNTARTPSRIRIVWIAFWFVLGFSFLFIIFGASLGLFGSALSGSRLWVERIGGIIAIGLGLLLLLEKEMLLFKGRMLAPALGHFSNGTPAAAFVLGATFGAGWTPCIGPILGIVLTFAAASATVGTGILLLSIYSLGLAIPFMLAALGFGTVLRYTTAVLPYLAVLRRISGVIFIFLGTLLFLDKSAILTRWSYDFFNAINVNWEALYNFF